MKRWIMIALALAAAGVGGMVLWPVFTVLEIVDLERAQVVLCARMAEDETFEIGFTHSVNRRPVRDTLQVASGRLLIVKSRFDTFGAGMPDTSDANGTLKVLEDGTLEYTLNRVVPEVTVRVGRVAEHRLELKGQTLRLDQLAPPGNPLSFRVRRRAMIAFGKGRCMW